MRNLTAILVLVAVAGVALAAGTTLSGTVKDANGKPMAEVIVRVAPADRSGGYRPVQTKTDAKGKFTLDTEETGPHTVSIQSVKAGDRFSTQLPAIEIKGKKQKVTLQLTKSEITGKITCQDTGKPPGDGVSISMYQVKPWTLAGSAWLEKEGKYRLRGFPPGLYRIYVNLDGYRKASHELEIKKNKKKKGLDFVLEPLKAGVVEFTVEDEKGEPLTGVRFSYASEPGVSSTLKVKANEDVPGLYVCTQLEAGTWKVYVSCEGRQPKRIEVVVKEGKTTKVSVTLTPK